MTADYNNFNLILDKEYKTLNPNDYVHNNKGELLFFYDYNPADVPVYPWTRDLDLTELHNTRKPHAIQWDPKGHANYNMPGTDCLGVPTFTHWTAEDVANRVKLSNINDFEPLTVKMVAYWFGWLLYRLNNSNLIDNGNDLR